MVTVNGMQPLPINRNPVSIGDDSRDNATSRTDSVASAVYAIATKLRVLQSGHLNFYLALLGGLLLVMLALALY